jgi:hypothetical protein
MAAMAESSESYIQKITDDTRRALAELRSQNERLRLQAAAFESDRNRLRQEKLRLQDQLMTAREERSLRHEEHCALMRRLSDVELENERVASQFLDIETQNTNLANLYVASYQLHSTLDFREVIQIVQEIVINLIGAESFAILLLDEKTNELKTIASEGEDVMPGIESISTRLGDGVLGSVAKTGESYYINQDLEDGGKVTLDKPLAAVPLKIKEHVIGLVVIYKLLQQKDSFSAVDYELFSLLAAHAATAIFSSKLYSQSERKLNTIQSFLDLLTTSS